MRPQSVKRATKTSVRKPRGGKKSNRAKTNFWLFFKRLLGGVVVGGLVTLVIMGIWYGSRLPSLTVTKIEVRGGETVPQEKVTTLAEQELEGEYLRLIPKRFVWLYPEENIKNKILAVERVDDVRVTRISGTEIAIDFTEYVPVALWCKSLSENECLFLDKKGFAFAPAPNLRGSSMVRYYRSGVVPTEKTSYVEAKYFANLQETSTLIGQEIGWLVMTVEIDQVNDVYLGLKGGGELRFTLNDPAPTVLANLQAVLSSKEFKIMKPSEFQYVDLRFGNKVFVNRSAVVDEEELEILPSIPTLTDDGIEVEAPGAEIIISESDVAEVAASSTAVDTENQ